MKPSYERTGEAIALVLCLTFAGAVSAQPIKEQLFRGASAALKEAKSVQAELYAPRNYERALKYYRHAQERFERGKNLEAIRSDLTKATEYFMKATQASGVARRNLAALIKTRAGAVEVNASRYAPDLWKHAESDFAKAVIELERGASELAQQRAKQAERMYRDAELVAIKATYLSETRLLIVRAEKERVDRYAPRTLQKSKNLLQKAEKVLTENRYDADLPRSLARQANYEAKHAMYLAKSIREATKEKLTMEQLILDWERPIQQIAAATDMAAEFDKGYQQPTNKIIAYIDNKQLNAQRLNQDVNDLQGEISALHAEITNMRRRLGGADEERIVLSERLHAQARVRKQFAQMEKLFTHNEARVMRESNDIIIRLIGLNFAVGQSTIDAHNYHLLTKVQHAVRAFPDSKLVIEGHTDSYGSDAANYALSERRAKAVKAYLLANMRIEPSKISAVGYGETRPIANNETKTGRAKNRRIDIVIRPRLSAYN
ncbi:MAG: OmpA family protein [Acidiferrobacterales bacterium]